MRGLKLLLVIAILSVTIPSITNASGAKPWVWSWWPSHWQGLDYQPYLGEQKIGQRFLWDTDNWTPEDWIKNEDDSKRIMRDLYAANIILDQYVNKDNIHSLKVGEGFIQLSGLDRQRVLKFVDHVFEITAYEENGMFYVFSKDDKKEPMGVYNKYGFLPY